MTMTIDERGEQIIRGLSDLENIPPEDVLTTALMLVRRYYEARSVGHHMAVVKEKGQASIIEVVKKADAKP